MILALFYYVALLRLILHYPLPPAPRFSVTVASKWLSMQRGGITHICLRNSCLVNEESICPLDQGWELTGTSCTAVWLFSDLALAEGCQSIHDILQPALLAVPLPVLTLGQQKPAHGHASPTLLCRTHYLNAADLMVLNYDSHVQTEETTMHTRPVSVNSARRAAISRGWR